MEIIEIGEKDLGLDYVVERRPGGREGLLEVFEDVGRLALDVRAVIGKVFTGAGLRGYPILEVARELPGGENEIADDKRLAVVGERTRRAGLDDLYVHVSSHRDGKAPGEQRAALTSRSTGNRDRSVATALALSC